MLLSVAAAAQEEFNLLEKKLLISLNIGNTAILRPQLSFEYRFKKWNGIELTAGYIMQNKSLQNITVKYLGEDAFLANGVYAGIAYKRTSALNTNSYYGVSTYFKQTGYKKENWANAIPQGTEGAMSYVLSNKKTQLALTFTGGTYKHLSNTILLNIFGGFGFVYYNGTKIFHERIYDNSFRYATNFEYDSTQGKYVVSEYKATPFEEKQQRLYPVIQAGIKLCFAK